MNSRFLASNYGFQDLDSGYLALDSGFALELNLKKMEKQSDPSDTFGRILLPWTTKQGGKLNCRPVKFSRSSVAAKDRDYIIYLL